MNLDILRESLQTATAQVLMESAFVLTEPAHDQNIEPDWPASLILASLTFEGPINGCFSLVAPHNLCSVMAADMTGEDEAANAGEDVLGEIVNMVAGLTLSLTLSSEGQWELGVPQVRHITPEERKAAEQPDVRIRLLTEEDEQIEATVSLAGKDR